MMSNRMGQWRALTVLLLATLVVSACGSGEGTDDVTEGTPTTQISVDTTSPEELSTSAADLLPQDVRDGGVFNLGTSLTWPPFAFEDEEGVPRGLDLDIAEAVSRELGLDLEITDIQFSSLIPGVESGRFHAAMNQFIDTEERREVVNFVDYYVSEMGFLVSPDLDLQLIDPSNLCGWKISAVQGSAQELMLEELMAECEARGEEPIEAQTYADVAGTLLAVSTGQADFSNTDYAVAVYTAAVTDADLQVHPDVVPGTDARSGIVLPKDNPDLVLAVQRALQNIIDSGEYQEIMEKWGVPGQAVEEATINTGLGLP